MESSTPMALEELAGRERGGSCFQTGYQCSSSSYSQLKAGAVEEQLGRPEPDHDLCRSQWVMLRFSEQEREGQAACTVHVQSTTGRREATDFFLSSSP